MKFLNKNKQYHKARLSECHLIFYILGHGATKYLLFFGLCFLAFSQSTHAQITNGMPAADLIGQYTTTAGFTNNFTQGIINNNNGSVNALGFNGPGHIEIDYVQNRMFLTENSNNRILVFNLDANNNLVDKTPDFVLGQPNFTTNTAATTAAGLRNPQGMAFHSPTNRLFVADDGNNRVVVYDVATITNGEVAVNVLGQTNFTNGTASVSSSRFDTPLDCTYNPTTNQLFVAENNNNRVLVFDVASITNGEAAVNVLGQTNFTNNAAAITQSGMSGPYGVLYDGTTNRLYVNQGVGNRLTVYDVASITNGEAAINVLGQPNFTTSSAGTTQAKLDSPQGIGLDVANQRLFVAEAGGTNGINNRVMVFDVTTITNGENAIHVLGQSNFTSSGSATTQTRFSWPDGIFYDNQNEKLYVPDLLNHRVMIFGLAISGTTTSATCGANGAVDITPTGLNGSYVYSWSNGATIQDLTNVVAGTYTVTVTDGLGGSAVQSFTVVSIPNINITNGMNASDLIGQYTTAAGFTNNWSQLSINNNQASVNALGLSEPEGITMDKVNHRLFVSDKDNHRVLVYNLDAGNNLIDKTPDFVLGQTDFTSNTAGTTQSKLNSPYGLAYDATNQRLFVSDYQNARVMVFNVTTITNGENAVNVLGQASFTTQTPNTTQSGMNANTSVLYDPATNRLFVTDNFNHRVLVFDVASITNGENAVNVLGQTSYTSGNSAVTQAGMDAPYALAYDAGTNRLFVGESDNNRVLVFDVATITNGENAVNVLGQPDFTTNTAATSQSGMRIVTGLSFDPVLNRLFVSELTNHRVTVFDVSTITNGENAISVLGQPNYTTNTFPTTQSKLRAPSASFYDETTGMFYVTERDNNRTTLFQIAFVTFTGTVTNATCGANGAINITAVNGTAPYTYNWGGGITTEDRTALAAGTYTVTVTDACGGSATGTFTITGPAPLSGTITSQTNVLCRGASTGAVTVAGSGGVAPYQYRLNSGAFGATATFTGLAAGSYTVTVRDANLCTFNVAVTLTQPSAALVATPTITQPSCFAFGSITLVSSGGTAPYTYDWADIPGTNNSQNRTSLSAGTYNVTITDANGCTATTAPMVLNAPSNCAPISVCQNNVASVFSVTPHPDNSTYTWTVPSGAIIVSGQGTPSIVINWNGVSPQAASICVVAQNVCGTAAQTCQNINIVAPPTPAATASPACVGANLQLNATGGTTYSWSGPSGFVSVSNNPLITNVSAANAGTYVVTVTNTVGCSATASVAVAVNAGPSLSIASVGSATCGLANGSLDLSVSGGTPAYTYVWSNGAITQDISGLSSGNYRVTVTDAAGCVASSAASISDVAGPTLTSTNTNASCFGGSNGAINLTITGGTSPYTTIWSNGATTEDLSNIPAGVYGVNVIDASGCSASRVVVISQPGIINTNFTQVNVNCFGASTGSIDLSVNGGTGAYTYTWTRNGSAFGGNTQDLSGLLSGVYAVTITDANLCTVTTSMTITQPTTGLTVTSSVTNVSCNGQSNGQVILNVSGGTLPYTYSWTGPSSFTATTKDITGRVAGTYNVTVTDSKGCTFPLTGIVINQPAVLAVSSVIPTNVSCFGGNNGSINATIAGGTAPYTYIWNNGNITEDLTGLSAGTFTVTVTDSKSCTATGTGTISQPTEILITPTKTDVACNGASTGTINLTVSGGTGAYTYTWSSGGASSASRTNLSAGDYRITVSDANNCTKITSVTINQNSLIVISGVTRDALCRNGATGEISVNVNGGVGTYTYAWSNSLPAQANQTGLLAGTYSVTVTDQVGCTRLSSFTVGQPLLLVATGVTTNVSCFETATGSVDVSVAGGISPYTYAWSSGANTEDVSGRIAGTYTVTVTDLNLCTTTASFAITQPTKLDFTGTITPNCDGQTNGSISINASGGTTPYSYTWSGTGSGSNPRTGLGTGIYRVTTTDARSCTKVDSFQLTPLTITLDKVDRSCTAANGVAVVGAVGGLAPYTYLWSNGATTNQIINLTAGVYTVTVTAGGCTKTGSVTIAIPSGCLPPDARNDIFTTLINTPLTGTAMPTNPANPGYDSDPVYPLSQLTFENLQALNPLIGSMNYDALGGFVFTPALNYTGTFSLLYEVCNPLNLCDTASIIITVNCPILTLGGATAVCVGSTANVTPNTGGTWISSNTGVATVTNAGVVTGVAAGTVTLTYTVSGTTCTATRSFTVTPTNTAATVSNTTLCINTPISRTQTTTGATGIGTATGLPAGVTVAWAANTITFSGSPSAAGTFNYTIPLTGGCGTVNATGTIVVTPNNTATAGTTTTLCFSTAISPVVTHTTTGAIGIGTATGLPAGVTAVWASNTITISGTPTASGTFNYTVPLTGGCGTVNATGTIIVTPNNAATAGTTTTLCISTAISPVVTHTTTGATGIGTPTGLPAGVTAAWAGNTITISGTPTVSGTFAYSIPLTGGCGSINATGTIIVNALPVLGGATAVCVGSTANVTPNTGGTWISSNTAVATVTNAGLITGVAAGTVTLTFTQTSTGCTATRSITVNATPSAPIVGAITQPTCSASTGVVALSGLPSGNWTITLNGGFTVTGNTATFNFGGLPPNSTNTFTVTNANNCTSPQSASAVINAIPGAPVLGGATSVCIGSTANVTPNTGGTWSSSNTGVATVTNAGVVTGVSAGTVTLTFTNTATNCSNSITFTVIPNNTAATVANTTLCINTAITRTQATTGATGIGTATGLPAGVTVAWAANTITFSGSPTASGTFNYTIPLTGGCGTVNATGTIIVTPNNTATSGTTTTLCVSAAISPVVTHTTTVATGIGTPTGLPAGVTAAWAGNTITISGTPTVSGTFAYSIPLTGGCGTINATGTIIVTPNNTAATVANTTLCINTAITRTQATTGATGIGTATGLPAGVTVAWAANTITFSGNPTASGTFNYTIPLTGGCGTVNATGTIIVTPNNTAATVANTSLCINTAITRTQVTTGATGIGTTTGLPAGVTVAWAANTITFSGSPTASGTFNYTIPLTGGCGTVNATGTIVVNASPILGGATAVCVGSTANVTPNIGGTWSSGNMAVATVNNSGVVTGVSAGTATLTFTETSTGCISTRSITVNALPGAPVVGTVTQPICTAPTGSVVLSGLPSGNWTITRSPGGTTTTGNTTSTTIAGLPAGATYTFTITNANACTSVPSANVVINSVPGAPVLGGATTVCIGSNANVTPNTGGTWISSNTSLATVTNAGVVTGVSAGTVTLTFTNTSTGCSSTRVFTVNNCSILNPDFNVTYINVPVTGDVSTNDKETPGSTYSNPPVNNNNPSPCMPVISGNGTYTFVCGVIGVYNFYVPVCEPAPNQSNCERILLQITVLPLNDPQVGPVANPDYVTTLQDVDVTIPVRNNDKCQNGPSCTLGTPTVITAPLHGIYTPSTGVYNPNANYVGIDSLKYRVCDNQVPAQCADAWAYINIEPTGTANLTNAMDDYAQTPLNTPAVGNVKTNDTDPEGNVQTVTAQTTTVVGKGTLVLATSGAFTFTPVNGFYGPVEFPYTTCDNGTPQACATATVHILVEPFDPQHNPDFDVTYINVPLTGDVSTNDKETPNSTYGNPPANPNNPDTCLPVVSSNGTYTFVCDTEGVYNFFVPVCEPAPNQSSCTRVLLQITVLPLNDPQVGPVANPDYVTTLQDVDVTIPVRNNDKCQNGPSCTLGTPTIITAPLYGIYTPSTGVYNPNANYVGIDSLKYRVCDNQVPAQCADAWVYITIEPTGTANLTNAMDDYAQTPLNTPAIGNVKTNDTDPEGNVQTVTAQTTTVAGKGTLVLATSGAYTFTPVNGFYGPVSFPYTTCDNGTPQACATATLHILVEPFDPQHNPDFGVTYINIPLTGDVSTNDKETPNSTYGNPPPNSNNPNTCLPVVSSNGTYTFVCGTVGVYNFFVPVCEPAPNQGSCTPVLLQITVLPENNPTVGPIANPDYVTTLQDVNVTIPVRDNDKCQNGPSCTLSTPTIITSPFGGTFTPSTGVYDPAPNFVGIDSFRYQVCDNQVPAKCAQAWVYITIEPTGTTNLTNAMDDYAQTPYQTPITGNVKTNDTDPEGNVQTVNAQTTTISGKGTLVLATTGVFTFTPVNGFYGPVSFPYTTCDNGTPQACATATIHVLVQPQLCITQNLKVLLEGPYVDNGSNGSTMTTKLNNLGYLPGQKPGTFFGIATPAGQPYSGTPWNYNGAEGVGYNHTPGVPSTYKANYPTTVTDWVLVSLRESSAVSSTVCTKAALLLNNGTVQMVSGFDCCNLDLAKTYYIVVEHRNHLLVMSHVKVGIVNNTITYDFTAQQSFRGLLGFGQKLINSKYVMYAGNGQQVISTSAVSDINVNDKDLWLLQNGQNSSYFKNDLELNGDANVQDKNLWLNNNGRFSDVPK